MKWNEQCYTAGIREFLQECPNEAAARKLEADYLAAYPPQGYNTYARAYQYLNRWFVTGYRNGSC